MTNIFSFVVSLFHIKKGKLLSFLAFFYVANNFSKKKTCD